MTAQEVFNRAWRWFVTEGRPLSHDGRGTCFYRGPRGARCAVGLLIPDDEYNDACEGGSVGASLPYLGPTVQALMVEHGSLLPRLQSAHDEAAARGTSISSALEVVAANHGLEVPS